MIYEVTDIRDDFPCFAVPLAKILGTLKEGGALQTLDPLEHHTHRQRAWYRGVLLPTMAKDCGGTEDDWDLFFKANCNGNELLKHERIMIKPGEYVDRLTIKGVGKRNMTAYIETILSMAITFEWNIQPPDPDLRT